MEDKVWIRKNSNGCKVMHTDGSHKEWDWYEVETNIQHSKKDMAAW